jgi:hypothetical protein
LILAVICEWKIQHGGPLVSGAEAGTGPAYRRARGTSMPRVDRTQWRRAPLKARPFRSGRSERHRLSPHRRRALPHPRHELPNPCHVLRSLPLTSPSFAGHNSKPTSSAIGFWRCRSASHCWPPRVLVRFRRSILELHHDAPVPTSPTTGAPRRYSSLAPVSPSIELPPPARALSGEPILFDVPQSGYPRCRVTLAVIPDPPHRWPMPESGRPPPPLLLAPWAFPCLAVGR